MSFDSLLGNEQLKSNLSRSLEKGHISHFYLISGPEGSGKHTLARLLAAALVCRGTHRPCLSCSACRKTMENIHPDVITVDDPEKKTVTVGLVREARADIYVRPNEAERKVYIFPRAQDMGLEGQNALLKVLEEPPEYGVFLLLTDNPQKLLPTVRSRCTELKMLPLEQTLLRNTLHREFPDLPDETLQAAVSRSGGFLGQARALLSEEAAPQTDALVQALCKNDVLGLMQTLVPLEKQKRDILTALVLDWQEISRQALSAKCGGSAVAPLAQMLSRSRTARQLLELSEIFGKAAMYLNANVSPAAVCGWLEWELR